MPIEKPINHGILPAKVPTLRELLKGALRGQYPSNYPQILSFPQKKSTSKQGEEDVPTPSLLVHPKNPKFLGRHW